MERVLNHTALAGRHLKHMTSLCSTLFLSENVKVLDYADKIVTTDKLENYSECYFPDKANLGRQQGLHKMLWWSKFCL